MSEQLLVGVLGARGKVGAEVCTAVREAADMELVAEVDAGDDIGVLVEAGAQAVVDFTHPDVVMDNLRFCIEHGIHAVCLLYTSPSPRDLSTSRMPSSA